MGAALARADWRLLFGAMTLLAPITLGVALRLRLLAPVRIGHGETLRLVLSAAVMNLFLPAKMGDVAKAVFIRNRGHMGGGAALALVTFEKLLDLFGPTLFCVLGLLTVAGEEPLLVTLTAGVAAVVLVVVVLLTWGVALARLAERLAALTHGPRADKLRSVAAGWRDVHARLWSRPGRLAAIVGLTLGVSFLHLLQIWLFMVALDLPVPFHHSLGLTGLAVLAGLFPLTFAGAGTRDAALIYFYRGYFDPAGAAAVGVLTTARYFLLALVGFPCFLRAIDRQRKTPVGTGVATGE